MSNARPAASDAAKIVNHLTQVILTSEGVDGLNVFYDGRLILPGQVDSLSVNIVAPGEKDAGTLTAQLSWKESGENKMASLFPGTVDIVGRGKRILVTSSTDEGSFDGLWLSLGLTEDGTSHELSGVQSLRVLLSPGLTDTKLSWTDGGEEAIL